jgi:DNA-directed RNA polymerase specialized sigma24 family protein
MQSVCSGSDEAIEYLFDRFAPKLYDYCETLLSDADAAADALSNTFLVAVDWAERLANPERVEIWLYALARNECLRILKWGGQVRPLSTRITEARPLRPQVPNPEWRVLREVDELIHGHGLDDKGVAAVLGISPARARTLAHRSATARIVSSGAGKRTEKLPRALRQRVLADAGNPMRTAYRGEIAGRSRRSGFPVPLDRVEFPRRTVLVAAATVGVVLLSALVNFQLSSDSPNRRANDPITAGPDGPSGSLPAPSETDLPTGSPSPVQSSTRPTPSPPRASPTSVVHPPVSLPPRPAPVGAITGVGGCLEGNRGGSGTGIEFLTCDGTIEQRWTVASDGSLRALGRCMTVKDGSAKNGTPVLLLGCSGGNAQKWRAGAKGALINRQTGRCLDGPNVPANPPQVEAWPCNGAPYQRWTLPH